MNNFNSIPKFCISVPGSPRRQVVTEEFKKYGVHNVIFFDAIDKKDVIVPEISEKLEMDKGIAPGILACMLSHVKLIKLAKAVGFKAICVFEDDVIFCDDFNDRIEQLETLGLEYDFLTLGGHFVKPDRNFIPNQECATKTENKNIYKIKHQGGTYAYIIRDTAYDFIIRNCNYNFGMDQFYSTHFYHRFNCLAIVPFLVSCKKGASEITGTTWVYENIDWFYSQARTLEVYKNTNTNLGPQVPPIISFTRRAATEYRKTHAAPKPAQHIPPRGNTSAIDLRDCTFITAVKIESKDREFNFLRIIQYICDNFATNILIKESDSYNHMVELLKLIDKKECTITATFEKNESGIFHRTRLLNEALFTVNTPVCINYDIDVFLDPAAYVFARNKIIDEGYDLVYPFKKGENIQIQVTVPEAIKNNYQGESLFNRAWQQPWQSYCGHVQFFKTESYLTGGMENEEFISYGPEDRERMERFQRLGYKVMWGDSIVYHLEHSRDENSSTKNPSFGNNEKLLTRLREMGDEEFIEYYQKAKYHEKYVKIIDLSK